VKREELNVKQATVEEGYRFTFYVLRFTMLPQ
jgi:hypothetical protein